MKKYLPALPLASTFAAPADQATGYRVGDLRGALTVKRVLP